MSNTIPYSNSIANLLYRRPFKYYYSIIEYWEEYNHNVTIDILISIAITNNDIGFVSDYLAQNRTDPSYLRGVISSMEMLLLISEYDTDTAIRLLNNTMILTIIRDKLFRDNWYDIKSTYEVLDQLSTSDLLDYSLTVEDCSIIHNLHSQYGLVRLYELAIDKSTLIRMLSEYNIVSPRDIIHQLQLM